jgi:AraC-like DNA-binding protein
MQRLFANEVGVGAKQFTKIVRVQQVVRLRQLDSQITWARAALHAGYYDQSHFNKDFRAVVGCAPSELYVEPQSLTESFLSEAEPERV